MRENHPAVNTGGKQGLQGGVRPTSRCSSDRRS